MSRLITPFFYQIDKRKMDKLKLSGRTRDLIISLLLALFVILIYWQTKDFKFVYYDDGSYVAERAQVMAGLTWEGLRWAMTATEAGFWHPLTWLSLMIDRQFFGNNPGGYHWTNVILHLINTLLLFLLLKKATGMPYRSAFVALFFAVHPLHVESVAWVSQRKDLLCTLFGFASFFSYVRYAEAPAVRRYVPVVVFFILGLMSKPMIVTLPFLMLLVDYWPLRRVMVDKFIDDDRVNISPQFMRQKFGFVLLEKIPLILLSLFASVMVIITEKKADALTNLGVLPVADRLANAAVSYIKYIVMMFWPFNLTFFYPHPVTTPVIQVVIALLLIIMITAFVVFMHKCKPYLFTGWFWYMGTLVPVIGLIQVGPHALADRYTYIPLIGLFLIIVWGMSDIFIYLKWNKKLLTALAAVIVVFISFSAWQQVGYWRNSVTLFEHALKIFPENYIALGNLGQFYINHGEYEKGLEYMHKAIRSKPNFAPFYYNTGLALHSRGDYANAAGYFKKAYDLSFTGEDNLRLLGDCYRLTGKPAEAVAVYEKALEIKNNDASIFYGLALAFMEMGRDGAATEQLKRALSSDPKHGSARKMLMFLSIKSGDKTTALAEGQKAVAGGEADAEVYKMMEIAGRKK